MLGSLPRLMLVTDRHRARPGALRASMLAGVPFVQFREKTGEDTAVAAGITRAAALDGTTLSPTTLPRQPLLSVNGRPELARRLGIGLHLPADHPSVDHDGLAVLGRSVHDGAEIDRSRVEVLDYLVIGTLFPSASKPGRVALGLAAFTRLVRLAEPVPVFAIGGITPERVADVLACGAHGVAVTGSILQAEDPAAATQAYLEELRT